MATHSVGVTKNIHREIERIKKKYGVTMGGFAIFALNAVVYSPAKVKKIVDDIEKNASKTDGAIRLERKGFWI